jgi:hypothetical protein
MVELNVEIVWPAPSEKGVAAGRVNGIGIGVSAITAIGHHQIFGQLHFEGHGYGDGVDDADVTCTGIVRRIQRVPLLYELCSERNTYVPIAQLEAVDVSSTLERRRDRHLPGGRLEIDQLLVDLEVTVEWP